MQFLWTQNRRYFLYFLRELTGPLIAGYIIYFLLNTFFDQGLAFTQTGTFRVVSWIGFAAAVFHTITWFWVTIKIMPFTLKKYRQIGLFISLLIIGIALSFFLLNFFYERASLASI